MKYLVMDTHPAYAVLLDEEGRCLKAANLRYQVGDTVENIVALREPAHNPLRFIKPLAGAAAIAACLCLVFFGYYQPNFTAYGTLRIQINPDVVMTLSRTERVLELDGLNPDGSNLIDGYVYQGKSRDTATAELVDRAIEMGYLSGGDAISITVTSRDADWQTAEEEQVHRQLEERYGEHVVVQAGPSPGKAVGEDGREIVIPVAPREPSSHMDSPSSAAPQPTLPPSGSAGGSYGDTNYDDTDYGPNNDGVTNYGDTDYGPNNDSVTDYGDTDYGPDNDGVTDYGNTDYGLNNDGVTDYGDTDYGSNTGGGDYSHGVTDYENRDDPWDDGDDGD